MPAPLPLIGKKLLLGVTGSIAAYKAADLVRQYKKAGAEVQVLMTPDAGRFIPPLTLGTLSQRSVLGEVFPENAEGRWTKHIDLGLWADLFVVAPATAQTLAKLAHGFCDSMLTATALAARCPLVVYPAMDHDMYLHAATQANLATLRQRGVDVREPEQGELASGLIGTGRLPEPATILQHTVDRLHPIGALTGKKVLVTAGPTREAIDPVRFLSNGSTGTMGFALAAEAARRGADVVLVAGPAALPTPPGVTRLDVTSADEMHAAAQHHADADYVFAAAAVSDYAPVHASDQKLKKADDDLQLTLRRTPDVLAALGARKRDGQTLVGFALETTDGDAHARAKLARKHLDWIALNYANREGEGFGPTTGRLRLLSKDGRTEALPRLPKSDLAALVLDAVVENGRATAEKQPTTKD